jgi:hypothetical protein
VKIDYCKYKMNAWKCKEKWSPERNKIDPKEGERREIIQILHTQLLVIPPILSSPL